MKTIGQILIFVSIFYALVLIAVGIGSNYEYSRDYYSYWNLADKSSSLNEKMNYINLFVDALEKSKLQGTHNVIIFKTPDNNFDKNLQALKSLQLRLKEISTMDVKSFEYQTAIQQITQQEQGEADNMLDVFKGSFFKVHYPIVWVFILIPELILLLILALIGSFLIDEY